MSATLDCKLQIHGDRRLSYSDTHHRAADGAVSDDYLTQRAVTRLADWVEQREDSVKQDFELLGRFLYRLLFGDDATPGTMRHEFETAYQVFREQAEQDESTRLRLWLIFDQEADELASLPWEFLFMPEPDDERAGIFLAGGETKLILTRFVPEVGDLVGTLPPEERPLRILVAYAFPEDPDENLPKLDPTEVIDQVEAIASDSISVDVLRNASFDELQARITKNRPHIVHFIGHGKPGRLALFRPGKDIEQELARTKRRVEAEWCSSDQVARLFEPHKPRLVFLHACHGGSAFADATSSSTSLKSLTNLARELAYARVPAVIAMQYSIPNRDAAEFAGAFYRALADGLPMDEAVAVARQQLARPTGREAFGHRRFATPVVYLQTSDPIMNAPERAPATIDLVACPNCKAQIAPAETVVRMSMDTCPFCQRPFARCENGHANLVGSRKCERCSGAIVGATAPAASSATAVAGDGATAEGTSDTSFRG